MGNLKHKTDKIGVQLGIAYNKLRELQEESDPLAAAIDYWLKGNAKEGVPPSWQSVVAALRSTQVDESGLAGEIEKKYCSESPTNCKEEITQYSTICS